MEKFGFWVGIIGSIVTIAGFLLQFGPSFRAKGYQLLKSSYPRVAALLFACSFGLSAFSIYLWTANSPDAPRKVFKSDFHFTVVADQNFENESVELDGKEFRNCSFRNVRLMFNGNAPFKLLHNNFYESLTIGSNDPRVDVGFGLLKGLGFIGDNVDTSGMKNVERPDTGILKR